MKRKVVTTATILLLAATTMFAATENDRKEKNGKSSKPETVTVSGTVIDLVSGESLAGVLVRISETDIAVYSDFDGNFTLENLIPGEYKITTNLISYKTATIEVKTEEAGEIKVSMETVR